MSGSSFTAGEESVTLDFANAEITKNDESIELSDLAEGDILTVEVGSSNTAASATVESVGGGQSFGGSGEVTQGTAATTISEDMFYITNTHCLLTLSGVNIVNNDADGALLRVVGNSASRGWGTAGSNGAQVEFAADGQTLAGDIIVDTISNLTMTMKNGSTFTGTVNIVDNAEGGTAVSDNAVVAIENGCTWNLTGNCTLTSLTSNGTINFNGYIITLADGTVLK